MGSGALIIGMALSTVLGTLEAQDTAPSRQTFSNEFNPAIGAIFDTRAVLSAKENDDEKITIDEIELSFAADVDPFLRAEAYIAIADEDGETHVEVEEAFAEYSTLAPNLSARFGKISGAVGRVNRNHTDQLQYLDYPLVTQAFFGEEGLRAPGAQLSYLIPSDRFLELTVQALVPEEETPIFMDARTSDPVLVAHLRTFFDFNPDLSGQLGLTFANGPTVEDSASVFGVDYTMKHQPGEQGRFWQLEAEAYWADATDSASDDTHGYFLSGTTSLTNRLFLTGRYDFVELPGTTGEDVRGYTANLTLRVSEFHFWRLEYNNFDTSFEGADNRLTLQFVWGIGAHPAHRY